MLVGGLARFRVLFSAIFHGVPSEIAIRVGNGGFWRKQNCCKLLPVYVHFVRELYLIKIAHFISVRSWSRSTVIMATRKSAEHREQKRVVAPFDPSAPVHRRQDRDDFIAVEEADHFRQCRGM